MRTTSAPRNIVVRTDSSSVIGLGHIMRCLTLADALREKGANVSFLCQDLPGNVNSIINDRGYRVIKLSGPGVEETQVALSQLKPVDWLVVDHYGIDDTWEQAIRPYVGAILVIDDKADRRHTCDALLDQNYFDGFESRYHGLVPPHCRLLLGPKYVLLRPEFHVARTRRRPGDSSTFRILAFFGGADPDNETSKFLKAVYELRRGDIVLDVLVGPMNPHRPEIERLVAEIPGARCIVGTNDMAGLMASADISVGAGGTTTWERLFLGIPSIVVSIADNQEIVAQDLADLGVQIYLGPCQKVQVSDYLRALSALLDQPELRESQVRTSAQFLDGHGTERVRDVIWGSSE